MGVYFHAKAEQNPKEYTYPYTLYHKGPPRFKGDWKKGKLFSAARARFSFWWSFFQKAPGGSSVSFRPPFSKGGEEARRARSPSKSGISFLPSFFLCACLLKEKSVEQIAQTPRLPRNEQIPGRGRRLDDPRTNAYRGTKNRRSPAGVHRKPLRDCAMRTLNGYRGTDVKL